MDQNMYCTENALMQHIVLLCFISDPNIKFATIKDIIYTYMNVYLFFFTSVKVINRPGVAGAVL